MDSTYKIIGADGKEYGPVALSELQKWVGEGRITGATQVSRSDQQGLVLASELMTVNSGIEACIRDQRLSQIPGLIQIGGADGMHTVDDSLIELLLADRINLIDAMAHARDPNFVKEQFQQALKSQRKARIAWIFGK